MTAADPSEDHARISEKAAGFVIGNWDKSLGELVISLLFYSYPQYIGFLLMLYNQIRPTDGHIRLLQLCRHTCRFHK